MERLELDGATGRPLPTEQWRHATPEAPDVSPSFVSGRQKGGRREEGEEEEGGVFVIFVRIVLFHSISKMFYHLCVCVCAVGRWMQTGNGHKKWRRISPIQPAEFHPKKKHNNKKKKTRQIQIQITAESQETKEERAWTQTPSIKWIQWIQFHGNELSITNEWESAWPSMPGRRRENGSGGGGGSGRGHRADELWPPWHPQETITRRRQHNPPLILLLR